MGYPRCCTPGRKAHRLVCVKVATRNELISYLALAVRAALAATGAVWAARELRLEYPFYAMLAAVIVTDASVKQTRHLGLQRLVGTAIGAVLGVLFSKMFGVELWVLGLVIALSMAAAVAIGFREAAKVSGYVAGIVVLNHGTEYWSYAWDRFFETALGIVFSMLLGVIFAWVSRFQKSAAD